MEIRHTFTASKQTEHGRIPRDRGQRVRPRGARALFWLSFGVPVLIMFIAFIAKGIYPFGDHMFLRTDLYHQYAPFLSELYAKMHEGGSLFWSWNIGGGTNFTALGAYYFASPLYLLLWLVPRRFLLEFIGYSTIFRIGLCGLTFSVFLSGHFGHRRIVLAPFSWCYALCAYIAAYSWNIMWLDAVILAPLVLLGIERIVKQRRPFLYIAALGLTLLMNYYIGFMVCIFSVLYFALQMIVQSGRPGRLRGWPRTVILFAVSSLIAGGISAVLLIPALQALSLTASTDGSLLGNLAGRFDIPEMIRTGNTWFRAYFNFFDMTARHCVIVETEQALDHWPNIYCGAAVFFTLPLFFAASGIRLREKIANAALLVFMLLSFQWNFLAFIWHGFHYPNSLPSRESFLYTALLLLVCCEGVMLIRRAKASTLLICALSAAVYLGLTGLFVHVDDVSDAAVLVTLLFAAGYAAFAILWRLKKIPSSAALILVCILLGCELFANMYVTSIPIDVRSSYLAGYDIYQHFLDEAEEDAGTLFYRVDKDQRCRITRNDGAWLGFRSVSVFSSTTIDSIGDLYHRYGIDRSTNAYSANGMTEIMQSLMGVRYLLSTDTDMDESAIFTLLDTEGGYCIYENRYAQSLGFMAGGEAWEDMDMIYGGPAECQNRLIRALTGSSAGVLAQIPASSDDSMTFATDGPGLIYLYIMDSEADSVTVTVNDETRHFAKVSRGYMLDLGWCPAGSLISVTYNASGGVTPEVSEGARCWMVDEEALIDAMNVLSEQSLEITEFEDTSVIGTITALEDGRLIVTIPFDPGWSVFVDGEQTEPESWQDAWFAIPLTAGTHEIRFSYSVPGLGRGLLITIISLLALAVLYYVIPAAGWHNTPSDHEDRRPRKKPRVGGDVSESPYSPDTGNIFSEEKT